MRIFCSICKDLFVPYSEVHVTNCGHLYHGSCISTWVKEHKTCPQCRAKISHPFRVYFDVEKDHRADPSTLEHELETVSDKLRQTERDKRSLEEDYDNVKGIVDSLKECALSLSNKNNILQASVKALKTQISRLTKKNQLLPKLESELTESKNKIQTLERIETILNGSVEEANKIFETTPVTELAVRQLCVYVGVLKSQLQKLEERNSRLSKENRDVRKSLVQKAMKDSSEAEEIKNLKESNFKLEQDLYQLRALYEDSKKELNKKQKNETKEKVTPQKKQKRSFFDIDTDFEDETSTSSHSFSPAKEDRRISQWEKMVCAGPNKTGRFFKNSKSFMRSLNNDKDDLSLQRLNSSYGFDGFGGREKIRLGCPTPAEEFEKIKRKKNKKHKLNPQNKKIHDYFDVQ